MLSFFFHAAIVAGLWGLPKLLAEPPQEIRAVSMVIVPPSLLGSEQPPPPPPPQVKPKVEPPPPPPPPKLEPKPEPKLEDVPVLKTEKPKKQSAPPPPPPPPSTPPPPAVQDPPKRRGSLFGNPLGASSNNATVGVEDPNFTYGYYLDRIVTMISQNWVRPMVGGEVVQATIYFRIQQDGTLSDLRLTEASGSDIFDQAAMRAVQASAPLPPLPKSYKRGYLGINLIVR